MLVGTILAYVILLVAVRAVRKLLPNGYPEWALPFLKVFLIPAAIVLGALVGAKKYVEELFV